MMAKAKKKVNPTKGEEMIENPEVLAEQISKTEEFLEQNKKMVFSVGGVLAVIVAAYFLYNYWITNQSQAAQNEMFQAVYYFEADSLDKALNGDGNNLGFLDIIAEYSMTDAANLATTNGNVTNIGEFAHNYLNVFTTGFHYAFAIAIGAMLISLVVYIANKNRFPDIKAKAASDSEGTSEIKMDPKEIKQRLYALFAVFGVVIFFWFSFHQNGLTLTFFAKDYTDLSSININFFGIRLVGAELFQSVNPFFVVFLTPIIVGLFGFLRNRGMEPSTPKKIAIGMFIAALAYVLMVVGSLDLPLLRDIKAQGGMDQSLKVTPFLLIGTYFILTVAELFISPLVISFVSKVSPPQYQGIMQGLWLGATALGNQLLFIGAIFYESIPIWTTWSIFVIACLISMTTMIILLKWLENVAQNRQDNTFWCFELQRTNFTFEGMEL